MRKCIPGAVVAAVLAVFPLGALAAPIVRFDIMDMNIHVGETFIVDILVDGVDPLDEVIAFGFDINFDAAWTEAAMPLVGPEFMDDSGSFIGTDIAGSVFPGPGPSGDGILLATLSFISTADGAFDLRILSDPLDPNEGLFTFNSLEPYDLTYSAKVTVNPITAGIPEPATVVLVGSGLLGMSYGRKRRNRSKQSGELCYSHQG